MKKNIHMPGEAGEWREAGREGRKDAGESKGRHQVTHFRFQPGPLSQALLNSQKSSRQD